MEPTVKNTYDAEYLALARQLGVPLFTFDRKLRTAAPEIALDPEGHRKLAGARKPPVINKSASAPEGAAEFTTKIQNVDFVAPRPCRGFPLFYHLPVAYAHRLISFSPLGLKSPYYPLQIAKDTDTDHHPLAVTLLARVMRRLLECAGRAQRRRRFWLAVGFNSRLRAIPKRCWASLATALQSLRRSGGMLAGLLLSAMIGVSAHAQTNLIQNPGFTDSKNPLVGWRTAFPYEGWYVDNVKYVKPAVMNGKACIVIDLPPGIAGNQGGKIESAFLKAEPGATYRVEIDCMTWDFSAKLHAEAWTHDPKPVNKPDKFRVPAAEDHPALVMCYRAQLPDPPSGSKKWSTVSREFTVPETLTVAGEDQVPEYLSLKAVVYAGTPNGGKSYFTNFRLTRIK